MAIDESQYTWRNGRWEPTNPTGYQPPDQSAPGFPVVTQDQKNQSGAPAGYTWDPVKQEYVHSPTQQGQAVNQYNTAASPALAGLLNSISGMGSGAASGSFTASGSGSSSGGGAGSGGNGFGTSGVSGGGYVSPIAMPDYHKATDAAFATAKDKAGKISRASLDALRGELGATGNLGGGAEVQGVRDIIAGGAGILGQASRDQAGKEADVASDFAKTGYAGSITQRGQDVSASEANARLAQEKELANSRMAFEQRQADSQKQLQLLTLALSGLKGSGGSSSGLVY